MRRYTFLAKTILPLVKKPLKGWVSASVLFTHAPRAKSSIFPLCRQGFLATRKSLKILKISDSTSVVLDVTAETSVSVAFSSRIAISAEDSTQTSVYLALDSNTTASITSVTTDTTEFASYLETYNANVATTEALLSVASYEFKIELSSADEITSSALVSLYIGDSSYDISQFSIYHLEDGGTEWTLASLSSVSYDGDYLSFVVNDFCTYGVAVSASTAVPEPSTYAMIIGLAALGFVAYRRRK